VEEGGGGSGVGGGGGRGGVGGGGGGGGGREGGRGGRIDLCTGMGRMIVFLLLAYVYLYIHDSFCCSFFIYV